MEMPLKEQWPDPSVPDGGLASGVGESTQAWQPTAQKAMAVITSDAVASPSYVGRNVLQIAAYRAVPLIYLPCQHTRGRVVKHPSAFEEGQTSKSLLLFGGKTSSKSTTAISGNNNFEQYHPSEH